ncbi:MAG TPA: MFS transporter [Ilumatobacteraceae bacterium]
MSAAPLPGHGTFGSALASRPFRLVLATYALGAATAGSMSIVVAIALYARTGSAAWAGVGAIVRVAPFVVLSPFSGVLSDRYDQVTVLRCALIAVTFTGAITVALLTDGPLWLVAGAGFVTQCCWTPVYPTTAALVPRVVGVRDLAPATSMVATLEAIAYFLGPGLGGLVVTVAGTTAAGASALVFSTIAIVTATMLRGDRLAPRPLKLRVAGEEPSFVRMFVDGVRTIFTTAAVAGPLVVLFAVEFVYGASQVVLLVAATEELGMSDGGFGLVVAVMGVGALVSIVIVNGLARSRRPRLVLAGCVAASSLPIAVVAGTDSPAVAIPLLGLSGLGIVLCEVILLTTLQRNTPMDRLGRVFGALDSLTIGAILLGTVVGSPLIAVFDVSGALLVLGLAVPAVAILMVPLLFRPPPLDAVRIEHMRPVVDLFSAVRVLSLASRTAVESMVAASQRVAVPVDTVVVREGEPADHFFVVESGALEVTEGGVPVRRIAPGDGFGELGLLHQVPRTATVTTLEPSVLHSVPGEAFLRALGPGRVTGGGVGLAASLKDIWAAG